MAEKILIQSRINRVFHWLFSIGVTLLLISGLYIHHPVDWGPFYDMGFNVLIQTTVGFFVSGVFFAWVYHHLVTQAYKDVWFRTRDIADLKGLMKYYFFIEEKTPVHGKYNAGQKLIYSSWVFAFVFMFLSGMVLYAANFGNILPLPIFLQTIRFYHYLVALYFLGTVLIHIYLVFTEDPAKLQAMFTGWVKR